MKRARSVAGVVLVLAGCTGADTGVYWQFERMLVQPRYEAYRGSRFFADGRAMQAPPPGTMPRGAASAAAATGAAAARTEAGYATAIPIPVTRVLLARGRRSFDITCAACHGVVGDGMSPVAMRMHLRPPPSLHSDSIRALPPGRLFEIVREGYGLMPSYASLLSIEESWAVVAYARALQLSQRAHLDELPAVLRQEALREANGAAARSGVTR